MSQRGESLTAAGVFSEFGGRRSPTSSPLSSGTFPVGCPQPVTGIGRTSSGVGKQSSTALAPQPGLRVPRDPTHGAQGPLRSARDTLPAARNPHAVPRDCHPAPKDPHPAAGGAGIAKVWSWVTDGALPGILPSPGPWWCLWSGHTPALGEGPVPLAPWPPLVPPQLSQGAVWDPCTFVYSSVLVNGLSQPNNAAVFMVLLFLAPTVSQADP